MFDTVHFWIGRVELSGASPFDTQPYLSEITERQNERAGYSCSGNTGEFAVNLGENGISIKGSLAKYYLGNNIETLTRQTAKLAMEKLSDNLHLKLSAARVTRLDVSTVIPTRRQPADYYTYLGQKPFFERLQSTKNTLYYNNHQRQIIFYDKTKEAHGAGVAIPEIFLTNNLFRYELRYTKRLNKQLKQAVTAAALTGETFYKTIIQNWHSEFKTIQKLKNQSFMIDNITTIKEAETALFAHLLQQSGVSVIDEFLNELRAKNTFKERQRYSELKRKLNKVIAAPTEQKNELMQELEKAIFNAAKYAM
jgi:hypothetical protein